VTYEYTGIKYTEQCNVHNRHR